MKRLLLFSVLLLILTGIYFSKKDTQVVLASERYDQLNATYYPNISHVFNEDSNGNVLCLFTNSFKELGNILYLFNPEANKGKIVVKAQRDIIYSAVIKDNWVTWVEKDTRFWDIKALNLESGNVLTILSGQYIKEVGDDYPTVTLTKNCVVFDLSLEDNQNRTYSAIQVYNLGNGSLNTIATNYNAPTEYLGHVKSHGDIVTWHKGICDFNKFHEKGILYSHNLSTGETKRVTNDEYSFTPVPGENFIIYIKKIASHTETANVSLLRTDNKSSDTLLTDSTIENHLEYWNPSTNGRYITWFNNLGKPMEIYDIQHRKLITLGKGGEKIPKVSGKWLTWSPPEKEKGLCFYNLDKR